MQLAVGASILLLLLVINVPLLQPIFNTHFLSLSEWITVITLALVPAITEEITKAYLSWHDAGSTQKKLCRKTAKNMMSLFQMYVRKRLPHHDL